MVGYANPTSGFTAFMAGTGPKWASDKEHFVNLMARNNYNTLFNMLKGKRMADVFGGGSDIRERLQTKATPNSRSYQLGDSHSADITQGGVTLQEYWKFYMSGFSWQDETMILNAGARLNTKARKEAWKNEWVRAYQDCFQDQIDFWDDQFWAKPNKSRMEGVDSKDIKSIPVFINAGTNGLFAQGSGDGGTWTTIHGKAPDDADMNGKYNPVSLTYGPTAASGFQIANPNNILYSLDIAIEKTKFKAPPLHQEYFEEDVQIPQDGGFFASSLWGKALIMYVWRGSQDRWTNEWDPYGNPLYAGVPFTWVTKLDTEPLYPLSTTGTASESTATIAGPRVYGIQPRYLKCMWHEERFMEKLAPVNSREEVTRWSLYYNTFATMFCTSRRHQFIISPAVSQTGISIPAVDATPATIPAAP